MLSQGVPDCSATVGLDNLHVYIGSDRSWHDFAFQGSTMRRLPAPSSLGEGNNARSNFRDFDGEQFQRVFPEEKRYFRTIERLGYPAGYSPDRRSFAAAVIAIDPGAALSTNWAASQIPKKLLLRSDGQEHRLDSLVGFSIYALAWRSDSERIAVVERNYDRTPRSLGAFIEPSWHGGVIYSDIVLSVYDLSGALACQALLSSKVPNASVAVEWDGK